MREGIVSLQEDPRSLYPRDEHGLLTAIHLGGDYSQPARLRCPRCGWDMVHGDDVYMTDANRETTHLRASGEDASARIRVINDNTSPIPDPGRRHATAIKFWCEECSARFTLEFVQHKGATLIEVRAEQWVSA